MIIKNTIQKFKIKNTEGFDIDNLAVPYEVKFPPRSPKQQILFLHRGKEICIDLINHKREKLKHFKLKDGKLINKAYLNKLSIEFVFKLTNHPLAKDILVGIIPDTETKYGKTCYGVLKKSGDINFFMIYTKKGTTDFEDDIIYVFGIWEVDLPKEIELKLFDSNYTAR